MFSGIVEGQSRILKITAVDQAFKILLERPFVFNDINEGDSISVDGTCLTVESVTPEHLEFTLGPETLKRTTWRILSGANFDDTPKRSVNLERSLRVGDRIHGHIVTGHIDDIGVVQKIVRQGVSLQLVVQIPVGLKSYLWPKGSVAINGVSLTINKINEELADTWTVELGLVPETLRRTNLSTLKVGDLVNLEVDFMARGLVHSRESLVE